MNKTSKPSTILQILALFFILNITPCSLKAQGPYGPAVIEFSAGNEYFHRYWVSNTGQPEFNIGYRYFSANSGLLSVSTLAHLETPLIYGTHYRIWGIDGEFASYGVLPLAFGGDTVRLFIKKQQIAYLGFDSFSNTINGKIRIRVEQVDHDVVADVWMLGKVWLGSSYSTNGWFLSSWFDYFFVDENAASTWVFHTDYGWVHTLSTSNQDITLWIDDLGAWVWTTSQIFAENPPRVWNYTTLTWQIWNNVTKVWEDL